LNFFGIKFIFTSTYMATPSTRPKATPYIANSAAGVVATAPTGETATSSMRSAGSTQPSDSNFPWTAGAVAQASGVSNTILNKSRVEHDAAYFARLRACADADTRYYAKIEAEYHAKIEADRIAAAEVAEAKRIADAKAMEIAIARDATEAAKRRARDDYDATIKLRIDELKYAMPGFASMHLFDQWHIAAEQIHAERNAPVIGDVDSAQSIAPKAKRARQHTTANAKIATMDVAVVAMDDMDMDDAIAAMYNAAVAAMDDDSDDIANNNSDDEHVDIDDTDQSFDSQSYDHQSQQFY